MVFYQSSGELTYLGWTGKKLFVDGTLPAGTAQVAYQVQAVRSTAVGEWAYYNVSFGTTGGLPFSVSVGEQTPQRQAA